jgi:meso-butanediol dehydrogenase/(S,S)-butanediol dehydrogenase/diacetyl reductase
MLLAGRTVLVTGAGRGIGRGVSQALVEAGAAVAALDLDGATAEETARTLRGGGSRVLALQADVTDESEVEAALEETAREFGGLDGLVNNAGVIRMAPALETTDDDWQVQLDVNVRALLSCCRLAARQMISRGSGGAIVNIASNAGKVGYPNMSAYNASKAAVISLTRSLAAEWAPHRINVNAVCPGAVDTPMLGSVAEWIAERVDGDADELLAAMTPAQLGRHIRPVEVGRIVAFLLSEHAEIIRGQAINVDGGETPY